MQIGNRFFDTDHHTYIMGILNVTPDSFSDGGSHNSIEHALQHCEKMLAEGADIIDIGGESTRPGYSLISEEEEMERVIPIIEAVKSRFNSVISLDTYKSRVAEEGIRAGVDLINDIWGLKYDNAMAKVIAKADVSCCLMHNRREARYDNFMADVSTDLADCLYLAEKAGISDSKIILDPGVGFAKSYEQNLTIIQNLNMITKLGYPVLLGTSRKSVIGQTLNAGTDQRLIGTVATSVIGVMNGCSFLRVHDVKENFEAVKMAEAILNA